MRIQIVNNHCDTRSVRVPGAKRKMVRLPAYGSVKIDLSSAAEAVELEIELRKVAPAATIIMPTTTVAAPAAETPDSGTARYDDFATTDSEQTGRVDPIVADDIAGSDSSADPVEDVQPTSDPESPVSEGDSEPAKRKRRSKK